MEKKNRRESQLAGKSLVKLGVGAMVVAAVAGFGGGLAGAATFQVNLRADLPDDNPGDGICRAVQNTDQKRLGNCSLRAAIMEANAWPGADKIVLGLGTYRLDYRGYSAEADGSRGDLDIVDKLQIVGLGKKLTTIDATSLNDRIFDIHGPGVVTMDGMSLTGGAAMGSPRDGYDSYQNEELSCPVVKPTDGADGGAILNRGAIVLLKDMHFENNRALCDGGAVENFGDGVMTMTDCDFAYNTAIGNGGAVESDEDSLMTITRADFQWNNAMENGGALANEDSMLTMKSGTMTYNSARGMGGGIWNGDSDPLTVKFCKITFNDAADGGGIFNNDGFLTQRYTLVENNSPNDIVDQQIPEDLPAADPVK